MFEATPTAASMRFARTARKSGVVKRPQALAVMGAPDLLGGGPLFGFDGDARACRTTHQLRPVAVGSLEGRKSEQRDNNHSAAIAALTNTGDHRRLRKRAARLVISARRDF